MILPLALWTVLSLVVAPEPAARRLALLAPAATPTALAAALADPDPVVARTAARRLLALGPVAAAHLPAIRAHGDTLLRANAALGLGDWGAAGVAPLATFLADADAAVRRNAVLAAARIRPVTDALVALQVRAGRDESQAVRDAAALAMAQAYQTVETIRLPADGWRWRTDPADAGRDAGWFGVVFDDTGWQTIGIEAAWQSFGHQDLGLAWYRRTIELPARDATGQRAMLWFGGVDEDAWVWLNGQPAGEHALGPTGWDKPFGLDVTELVRWGGRTSSRCGSITAPCRRDLAAVTLRLSVLAK